jgi:thiamine kinase-like enzyme
VSTIDPLGGLLDRLSTLLGPQRGKAEALSGGMTNRNYRVRMGDGDYVIRVTSADTALLEIDREAEYRAAQAAAQLGLGPPVAAFLPEAGCLVTEFIPGRPLPPEELGDPAMLPQVARAVRGFHDGPAIPARFSSFRVVEHYARTALERGAVLPGGYDAARRVAREIEALLVGPEHVPVPCHNDLLNANMIHDGVRVRLVDWEYAGMGDRYFDLGNLSINNGLDEDADQRLLSAYFGEPWTPRRFACLRLMRIMSDFREAMWGVVQTVVSRIPFDYTAYAVRHFDRLAASVADPRFRPWLESLRVTKP